MSKNSMYDAEIRLSYKAYRNLGTTTQTLKALEK